MGFLLVSIAACLAAAMPDGGSGVSNQDGSPESALQRVEARSRVFRDCVSRMTPSLVRIETVGGAQPTQPPPVEEDDAEAPKPPPRQVPFKDTPGSAFRLADGPTTGIIWSGDGLIVTSSFNFVRQPLIISVVLADGRRVAADLVARDQVHKVALLKIDATDLRTPEWVPVEQVRVGQTALAMGLGFGSKEPAVSAGVISALGRMSGSCVQTDALLSPANYGGPLVDLDGRIIGLCVPMAQRPGELAGVEMYDAGVGFALTCDRVRSIVEELSTGRNVYRGWLGIQVDPRRPDAVIVGRIADPSPMREAGARPGDRIVELEGRRVLHYGHFVQALALMPAGREIALRLIRGEEPIALRVRLARAEELGPLPEETGEPFDPADPQGKPPKTPRP